MKKVIVMLIIGLLAMDLMVVTGRGYVLTALAARLLGPSECSLAEVLGEQEMERAAPALVSKLTLERTEAGLDLWNTPQGPIWTVHGTTILPFLMAEQLRDIYEPKGHEVRRGDIVLDCGANIGVFTRKALSRGAGLVVAIEPAPQTLAAFRRNFETEIREGRVVVYPKGVWDHDAEMELSLDEGNPGGNTVVMSQEAAAPKVRVPLTTIDKIVAELKLPRVDFIKMDIEGAEKPALKGAENTIQRFRPRMSVSMEHLADDSTAIPRLVHSIEPNYSHQGCDCMATRKGIKALVVAFDPIH
jgi:FkbM family methyltransferase